MKMPEPTRRGYRLVLAPAMGALMLAGACGGKEFAILNDPLGGTGGAAWHDAGQFGRGGGDLRGGAGSSSNSGAAGERWAQGGSLDAAGAGGTIGVEPVASSGAGDSAGAAAAGAGGCAGAVETEDGGQSGLEGGSGGAPQGGETAAGAAGMAGGNGCDAADWFPDGDGDGYGRSSGKVTACLKPDTGTWVLAGGDCNDDDDQVLPDPQRARFSGAPYITPEGGQSFDYDCSGAEVSDPSQLGAAPSCGGLGILDCAGKAPGFLPTDHAGPGLNPLCGSDRLARCVASGLTCVASVETVSEPHRCR